MPPSMGHQAYPRSALLIRLSFQDTLTAQLKGTQSKDTGAVECCNVHEQDVAIVSC